jgi:copine 5/8/9
MVKHYDFFDYLKSGLEISLMVAIDFSTGKNGKTLNKFLTAESLLFTDNEEDNFEQSISIVGSILDNYDSDHKYPVYGFGDKNNFWFACNGDNDKPEVQGITGILEAYKKASQTVQPTESASFSPIIKKAAQYAKVADDTYFILLILTHGSINDMKDTVDEIIEASSYPFSIVIVGIGQNDFSSMIVLDAEKNDLQNKEGKKAKRDVVQFVDFNKYKRNPQKLAQTVLQEIPEQFEQYAYMNKKLPSDYSQIRNQEKDHGDVELIEVTIHDESPIIMNEIIPEEKEEISIQMLDPDQKIEEVEVIETDL